MWAIFHRGDNRWVYKKTRVYGYVGGLPLVHLERPHPAVTLPEFLFPTENEARLATEERNLNGDSTISAKVVR